MAPLNDLIGANLDPDELMQTSLQDIFSSSQLKPIKRQTSTFDPQPLQQPGFDSDDAGRLVWEGLGLPVYSFLDTALFGIPGWVIPDEFEEDYLTPKTKLGQVTSAVGGTAGFIAGAPMKVGAKATQMIAKPFIKRAGAETVEQVIKKTADDVVSNAHRSQFSTKAKMDFIKKDVKKTITSLSHQHRWDKAGQKE